MAESILDRIKAFRAQRLYVRLAPLKFQIRHARPHESSEIKVGAWPIVVHWDEDRDDRVLWLILDLDELGVTRDVVSVHESKGGCTITVQPGCGAPVARKLGFGDHKGGCWACLDGDLWTIDVEEVQELPPLWQPGPAASRFTSYAQDDAWVARAMDTRAQTA